MSRFSRRSTPNLEELERRITPTLVGHQLFPSDNAWNQNVSAAPVDPNSPAMIATIGATTRLTPDWGAHPNNLYQQARMYGIPVNIVHGNSANVVRTHVVIGNYPGESDVVDVPLPTTYAPVIEGDLPDGPNNNGPGGDTGQRGDSHLIVWDEDTNTAYELYGASRPTDPNLFPDRNGVEQTNPGGWHAAQETVFDMKTNVYRTLGATSADAAGLSILAGLVRPDEGLPVSAGGQGAITHALRVTLNGNQLASAQFTYPASHMITGNAGPIPMGARLRLKNTPTVAAKLAAMGPQSRIIATALQQYGLIVADKGSPMYVTGVDEFVDDVDGLPHRTWDELDIFASNSQGASTGLEALKGGDFEVVDLAPIVTGLSVSTAAPGNTIVVNGKNFSGAGGRLSVLFGNTPSTSVTVVSDTQLTALVPPGAGTVHVQVQSGIIQIDQNDLPQYHPNRSESIASGFQSTDLFGYGVSATSAADQFTFGTGVGVASALAFVQQPGNIVAGGTINPAVTVRVVDSFGIVVPTANNSVTVALGANPGGGPLSGTLTVNAVNGVATFSSLSLTKAGAGYTLTATGLGLTGATSAAFSVSPGAFTALAFAQPLGAVSGSAFAPAAVVRLTDAYGNVVPTASGTVTITVGTNPGNALSLAPTSTTSVPSANGVATFTNLIPVGAGVGFTLVAHLNTLSVASAPFRSVTQSHVMPVVVAGDVFGPHPNASANEAFVKGLYHEVLGRDAAPSEATFYAGQLANGQLTRAQAVANFWNSPENRTREVVNYYNIFLNRNPAQNEIDYYVQRLQAGTDETVIVNNFFHSPEELSASNSVYVTRLYQGLLSRAPSAAEVAYYVNLLNTGTMRDTVFQGFLHAPEPAKVAVESYYLAYLQRPVAAAEENYYVPLIAAGTQTYGGVAKTLLGSAEFFADAGAAVP